MAKPLAEPIANGTLNFRGRSSGLSAGDRRRCCGRVSNINRPSDVAGFYGAAGVGFAVGSGARAIVLTNQRVRC